MPLPRWMSRSALLAAAMFGAVALTACGGTTPAPTGSAGSTTSAPGSTTRSTGPAPTPGAAAPLTVPDAAATDLCNMLRPELSNFRVQGPTLGRIGLNALVHEWALRNGGINGQVLADKAVVDRTLTGACPDVHQQAIEALGLPNLAAGIAF
ncbi:hypothetical protein [Nocardia sp. NPDC057227]|uniref:hypothetical protein n=1 Tax=Nocardia sp. NPDC057227 TaxID=3346056 RepID=UPI00362E665C